VTTQRRSSVLALVAANALASVACNSGKTAAVDAGNPVVDAGRSPCDSGNGSPVDAGGTIADAGSPGPVVVTTLASGNFGPNGIATDGKEVFWAGNYASGSEGIWEVSVDGGAVTTVAAVASSTQFAFSVALDGTNVYWTSTDFSTPIPDGGAPSDILSTPRAGGSTTVLLSGQDMITGLAVDETSLYWGSQGSDGEAVMMRMPLAGGAPETLATASTVSSVCNWGCIAVDSTSVYWAPAGSIMRVPLSCGMPISLAPTGTVNALAVAATGVYWEQTNSPIDAGTCSVQSVPLGGGHVTTIASYDTFPIQPIAVDATNVYWAYLDCNATCGSAPACTCADIVSAPLAGGPPSTLVTGLAERPFALAVDATSVYWVGQDTSSSSCGQQCAVVKKLTPK
jgi:hypothetical protein